MVKTRFEIYCEDHRENAPLEAKQEAEDEEEADSLLLYLCVVCKDGRDEAQTIICDTCDRAWHTLCHEPKVILTSE